ncbi:hypothetical protein MYP_3333 [Sporocytophaga myxococcoides]|uniref:Uncharacterized protein n=1 Tax=Sporocytophaga myxococcoides TaxID=153721 RepID=A0A098LI17_9BACT|nr:hypothetical protein MYP_3333 [Sporocytophaga myxococcoides]
MKDSIYFHSRIVFSPPILFVLFESKKIIIRSSINIISSAALKQILYCERI